MNLRLKCKRKQREVLRRGLAGVLLVAGLSCLPGTSIAAEQEVIETGKHEFQRSCATCHGSEAKGDGPNAAILLAKPSDLTQLRNKHGGTFLFWRVYEQINGSDANTIRGHGIRGHGTREMPIWGEQFRFDRQATADNKMGVRGRILSLVHYLESIQEK
jgi:mono/diheme cytochrome c family protein